MPSDSDAGLTVTDHEPLTSVTVDADQPISRLWPDLVDHDAIRSAFIDAALSIADGKSVDELYDALADTDIPIHLHSWIRQLATGDRDAVWKLVGEIVPRLGHGHSTTDDILAVATIFDEADATPTIGVRVSTAFLDRDRAQREDVLELLAHLSTGCDVRIVASGLVQARLRSTHRQDLPSVSHWTNTPRTESPVEARVEAAIEGIDPESRAVDLLRELADRPTETATYAELYAAATVGKSRVRQVLSELSEHGLVEPFGWNGDRHVEITEAGQQFVDALDQDVGRQQTLDAAVSDTSNSHIQAVYPAQAREGGEGDAGPYRTRYSTRSSHAAAVGSAELGAVTVLRDSTVRDADLDDRRLKYVSHDRDRQEAVVSVRATGALQYIVSVATALTHRDFLSQIISDEALDALEEPPMILREARNIGELSSDALEDAELLVDEFVSWGEEIESMTTDLNRGEYEDRDRFRSAIMRSAHGLAGSLVHLFDVLDEDLVLDIRVPAGLGNKKHRELSRTIGISAAIQSRYGAYASYRHLFESAAESPAFTPTIDAADPAGTVIPGILVRGPDAHRLTDDLRSTLRRPSELRESPTEFVVHVPLREAGRSEYGTAIGQLLSYKRLRPTPATMAVLYALCPSPFAAAEALLRSLEAEGITRELRPDEVRTALATVPDEDLCPRVATDTVGKLVSELLTSTERRTQTELATAIGVTSETAGKHLRTLESLGFVTEAAGGWRFSLSYSDPERGERTATGVVLPAPVDDDRGLMSILTDVLEQLLPVEQFSDPDDPIGGALYWPPDPAPIVEADGPIGAWAGIAVRLCSTDADDELDAAAPEETVVTMGPPVRQRALEDSRTTPEVTS